MGILEEIQRVSELIQRHSLLRVTAIGDLELLNIAQNNSITPWEAMKAALDLGIWPKRYLRNLETLTIQEQRRLHLAHVAVIGAGGLGGQVLTCLVRVGIGMLTLVDPDTFEESNLNRQAFSAISSMGLPKVDQAEQRLKDINPFCKFRKFHKKFEVSSSEEILRDVYVVVDALDNRKDRILLQEISRQMKIPLVHGAVAGLEGHVMTILPGDEGLDKLYTDPEPEEAMRPEAVLGVLAPTPMLIGTLEATEVIKLILGRGSLIRSQILYVDLETAGFHLFQF